MNIIVDFKKEINAYLDKVLAWVIRMKKSCFVRLVVIFITIET